MTEQTFSASGRRKSSVARVSLTPGGGDIQINGSPAGQYLGRESLLLLVRQPLEAADAAGKFDVRVQVKGGGIAGQAGAVRLGVARALVKADETVKKKLRKAGFLTRDARERERRKYGLAGRRKAFQFSKR
jgi:small subunit ribosomal protein S9